MTTASSALEHQEKEESFAFVSVVLVSLPRQVSRKLAGDSKQNEVGFFLYSEISKRSHFYLFLY